jgi:hypothetical protein
VGAGTGGVGSGAGGSGLGSGVGAGGLGSGVGRGGPGIPAAVECVMAPGFARAARTPAGRQAKRHVLQHGARYAHLTVPETQTIRVLHCNTGGDGWTADSPDLKGWNVSSASYGESKKRAEAAVRAQLASDGPAPADELQITHHIACSR